MTSTALLVTVVLTAFATMASTTFALAARIGTQVDKQGDRIDKQGDRIDRLIESMNTRFDRQDEQIAARFDGQSEQIATRFDRQDEQIATRFDRQDERMDRLAGEVAALRAVVAGLDGRVATLESR